MPADQPILVVVINLDRRTDRLAAMAADLDGMGVVWERLSATNGVDASATLRDLPPKTQGPLGVLTTGTRACSSSHFRAAARLLESGASHALVLEDDAQLAADLPAFVRSTDWIPHDAHLIKVEKFNADRPSTLLVGRKAAEIGTTGRVLRRMLSRHTGSAGYVLSRRGAEQILAAAPGIDVPIDHFLFNNTLSPVFDKLNPHLVLPGLVRQKRDDISDIAAPAPKNFARRLNSLRRGWAELSGMPRQLFGLATGRAELAEFTYADQVTPKNSPQS